MHNIWVASWQHCDWVGRTVLVVLVGISVVSWAIIFEKIFLFRTVERENRAFGKAFSAGKLGDFPHSSWGRVLSKVLREKSKTPLEDEKLLNLLHATARKELAELESKLDFLLMASSIGPFLGLLGTVWGLLVAFHAMSLAGSSSITVVASGVAEALITTVVGLLVAIPAAAGYTYLGGKLSRMRQEGEDMLESIYLVLK